MGVAGQNTVRGDLLDTPHADVLADLGDQVGTRLFDAAAVCELFVGKGRGIRRTRRQSGRCNGFRKCDKVLILGNEIGFRVDLDHRRLVAVLRDDDAAVGRHAAGFLVGFRLAGLAQVFRCQIHITVRFDQRLLALHHASAGALAEFLYHRC